MYDRLHKAYENIYWLPYMTLKTCTRKGGVAKHGKVMLHHEHFLGMPGGQLGGVMRVWCACSGAHAA